MMFSFIVPVYNVKNYLPNCLDSVLQQTNTDFEIILIDDGSTDGSEKICDDYAKRYPVQIKCIHQFNKGQSAARNAGIENARGDYLIMLDADDYLDNKYFLEVVYPEQTDMDIIAFSWKEVPDGFNKESIESDQSLKELRYEYRSGKEYLWAGLEKNHLYVWYAWRYFFKREFWNKNGFTFMEGIKYEDVELIYKVLLKAGKVLVRADDVGYCYRTHRKGSTVYDPNIKTYRDMIIIAEKNISEILERTDLEKNLSRALCNNFSCMYYAVMLNMEFIKDKKDWNIMVDFLDKHKQICKYTYEKKQVLVRMMIRFLGIGLTARILGFRTRVKYGVRG